MNKLITANNAGRDNTKLPKIIVDYKLCYLYGTVKIQKPHYPLHPIKSEIPTLIHKYTKMINQLITPYLTSKYNKINTRINSNPTYLNPIMEY